MGRSFVILHGLGGSSPEHWQAWLRKELVKQGETVRFPDFPDKDQPDKTVWLNRLSNILEEIPSEEKVTVVAHSLACILWFHYAASALKRKVHRAILVAPPSPLLQYEPVETFFPIPENMEEVAKAAEKTLFVFSSSDSYCSISDASKYMDLGIPCVMLPQMGHINVASGYGSWPWIADVCLNNQVAL
ncbi:RBBP9/YdeN family alpha/beta hydrolase [Paenibacillus sp. GCM10027627]|uniref:RBBP9/YdeN family alpha/beta hydrolase n=1 Tax=unclassified Paenibacillus TaxID=185978 RepID=UPI0036437CBD